MNLLRISFMKLQNFALSQNLNFVKMERTAHDEASRLARFHAFLQCPSLFEHSLPDGTPLFETGSDLHGNELLAEIKNDHLRFGHEMERYFAAWLQGNRRYELLLQNLQVVSDGITMGELDFVVHDKAVDEIIHIELAYKFYILDHVEGVPKWVGPNRRDDLDSKLYKLNSRQFPLLFHPLCQNALRKHGIEATSVRQMACLKGQLFLPQGHTGPLPGQVNPHAVSGTWTTLTAFQAGHECGQHYCLPAKTDWVLPPDNAHNWLARREALQALKAHDRAQLCWIRQADGSFERLMVLP